MAQLFPALGGYAHATTWAFNRDPTPKSRISVAPDYTRRKGQVSVRGQLSELSFSLLHVALALSSGRSRPSSRSRRKRRPIASHCRSSRNHSRSRSTDHQTRTRRNCGCGTYGGNGHGSGHGPMQCAHSTPEHVRRSPVLCSSGRRASRGPHFHHASPWVQDHHHGNGLLNKGGGRRR
jgi:hypothetical protein